MASPPHRRRRAEDDEDEDDADSSRSTPSESQKRARTNEYQTSPSPDPDDFDSPRPQTNGHATRDSGENEAAVGHGGFQPGAIIRVKLTNFVTYESAEFFPGPNLNMVIGPNGTGKSSLVCAICLGLGWGAKHLGRAGEVGEFVKHGMPDAQIEIELQRRSSDPINYVIRSRIIRDGNSREWWLNDKKTSLKAVQNLTRSLSIQIDNLCQFLPQDKVSEFAALTPVELLQQTQRAAAPEEMLEWHDDLKKYRKEQKQLEQQNNGDKEQLGTYQTRQDGLRAEVKRLEERREIQEQVAFLKKIRPFVEYRHAVKEHRIFKGRKIAAKERLKRLNARLGPTLQSIEQKKSLATQVSAVVDERKKAVKLAEKAADKCFSDIEQKDEEISNYDDKVSAEKKRAKDAQVKLSQLQRKVAELKVQANRELPVFDNVSYNDRLRVQTHIIRDAKFRIQEVEPECDFLTEQGKQNRKEKQDALRRLADLDTQDGQQMSRLEYFNKDTAKAWKWIQENMETFEQSVYGPPIISCSLKDPRYADAVESCMTEKDWLTLTVQTPGDYEKLSEKLDGEMALRDVYIRRSGQQELPPRPSYSQDDMRSLGFDGWASDFVDGPLPVLAMLYWSSGIYRTAVGLKDGNDSQHQRIIADNKVKSWITGKTSARVTSRKEYGPAATSTSIQPVRPARFWTEQATDSSGKQEIKEQLEANESAHKDLKAKVMPLREELSDLKSKVEEAQSIHDEISREKNELQELKTKHLALPTKIEEEQELVDKQFASRVKILQNIDRFGTQQDVALQSKAHQALLYKERVETIRSCHEELLEAEIRLIEAQSDVDTLEERNSGIVQQQEQEKLLAQEAERESKVATERARRALEVCKEVQAEENPETNEKIAGIPDDLTSDTLEIDISTEEAKLEFIQANNPNAIKQFEDFQTRVDKLTAKVDEADKKLAKLQEKITQTRGKWEPELDKLISEISDAFAYNFEQIGCAGEVGVEKTDDFEDWAIKIKVKFRQNEQLQVLDKHRQSGGERSVSTIFYLMALQSLARSPFRVVDEINQGMDPRNERMVHERMVEIACKEHTSQYFLITPKLLTGLRYDRRMKVLCIASGEHMPQDYRQLDVRGIINFKRAIVGAA